MQSVSPPPTPVKKEKKLPPHLQKEFDRVYAQMGDREPSPETMAASRRIRALGKLDPTEDPPAERSSRTLDVVKPSSRLASKSPRRRERESRTPSTVREVTPRVSISPEPYRPKTPKVRTDYQQEWPVIHPSQVHVILSTCSLRIFYFFNQIV